MNFFKKIDAFNQYISFHIFGCNGFLCFAIVLGSVPLLSLKSSAAAGDKPTSLKVYVYNLGGDDFFQMVQGSTKTYLIGDRTFSTTKEDNWTLEYDPSSGTLTMRNF